MGLKPPCFFPQCSPAPRNEHQGVWEHFYVGLVLTLLEPMPHRAFSLPFPGMMSPSLRVWVMPLYRGTQFGAEVEIPFWGIWQVRRVSKSLCAHVCECMCTCVLGHAPVTAGCIIVQGKTLMNMKKLICLKYLHR